jgi:hypothetical protein
MGMTTDFQTFQKALDGQYVELVFISTKPNSPQISKYEPGRIFYILKQIKNNLGLNSHFIFNIRFDSEKRVTLEEFLNSAETSFKRFLNKSQAPNDLSTKEQAGIINKTIASKSKIFNDWLQKTTSLQFFRPSMLFEIY